MSLVSTELEREDAVSLCELFNSQRQTNDVRYVVLTDEFDINETETN